jgi:DNA-directed RNA polymerase subunit RPC12/RpoP
VSHTWPADFTPVWVALDHVECVGVWQGARCRKVLGRHLQGSIEIKCPRCKHRDVYTQKTVDNVVP